jgi:hypothetical protein
MERPYRTAIVAGSMVVLGLLWFLLQQSGQPPAGSGEPAFQGTWTDTKGPPGNRLRLEQVARPIPIKLLDVEALEGKGLIRGLSGEGESPLTWNYESFQPLRLNVIIGKRAMVMPIRMLDVDHMFIRLVPAADVAEWSGEKARAGSEEVLLTRTKHVAE